MGFLVSSSSPTFVIVPTVILVLVVPTTSVEGFSPTVTPFPGRRGGFRLDPRVDHSPGGTSSTTKPVVAVGPLERSPPKNGSTRTRRIGTFVPDVDHFRPSSRCSTPAVRTYVDAEVLVAGGRGRPSVPAQSRHGDVEREPFHPFHFAPMGRSRIPSEAVVLLFQEPFLKEYRSPPRADWCGERRPPPPTPAPQTASSPSPGDDASFVPPRTEDREDVTCPPPLRDVSMHMAIPSPPPFTSGSNHLYRDVEDALVWTSAAEEEELRWRHWLGRFVSHGRRKNHVHDRKDPPPSDPATTGPEPDPFDDDPQLRVWVNLQRDWYRRMMDGDGGGRMTPRRARLLREAGLDLDLDLDRTRSRQTPRRGQLASKDTCGDDDCDGVGGGGEGVGEAGTCDVGGAGGGRAVRRKASTSTLDDRKTSAVAAGGSRTEGTGPDPRISLEGDDGNGDKDVPRSRSGPGRRAPGRGNAVEKFSRRSPVPAPSGWTAEGATPSLDPRGATIQKNVGSDRGTTTQHTPETSTPHGGKKKGRARVPFSERLRQLAEFRSEHGHLVVPRGHPTLGSYVNNARVQYRRWCDGKSSTMTPERVSALEELGFVWRVGRNPDESWLRRLEELEAFVARHGHCDVPHDCVENPSLGRWAARQRAQYRRLRRGEKSTLTRCSGRGGETTSTRLDDLEWLGFEWVRQRRRGGRGEDHSSSVVGEDHRTTRKAAVPNSIKKKGVRLLEVPPAPPHAVRRTRRRRPQAAASDGVERVAPRNLTVAC